MNEANAAIEARNAPKVRYSVSRGKWIFRATVAILTGLAAVPFLLTWLQIHGVQRGDELFLAIRSNDSVKVEKLLRAGVDPNVRDSLPPPRSAGELIDRLLDPHAQDSQKTTPLLAALCMQQPDPCCRDQVTYNPNPNSAIIRSLLEKGANASVTDATLTPSVTFAVASGNSEVVGLLLQHGVSVEQTDAAGSSLLLISAGQGQTRMMRYLISHGANVNARNTAGESALICAVRYSRSPDAVKFLLDHPIDPNIADSRGKTALFYAHNPDASLAPSQTRLLPQVIQILNGAGAR